MRSREEIIEMVKDMSVEELAHELVVSGQNLESKVYSHKYYRDQIKLVIEIVTAELVNRKEVLK